LCQIDIEIEARQYWKRKFNLSSSVPLRIFRIQALVPGDEGMIDGAGVWLLRLSMSRPRTPVFQTLLFLLPPSCMVAPIEETANKFNFPTPFSSTIQSNNQ